MLALIVIGLVTLLAQATSPDTGDLVGLGIIAFAMVVGATITYRWVAVPERTRADKAEAEKTDAYRTTLPALAASSDLADRVLSVLPGVEALMAPPKRTRS